MKMKSMENKLITDNEPSLKVVQSPVLMQFNFFLDLLHVVLENMLIRALAMHNTNFAKFA